MGVNQMIKIGDYLKKVRLQNNLTQEQFAKKLNITRTAYANYEKNLREPNKKVLDSISNVFDVDLIELIAQENSKIKTFSPSKETEKKFGELLHQILKDRVDIDGYLYHVSSSDYEYVLNHCFSFINNFLEYKISSMKDKVDDIKENTNNSTAISTLSEEDINNIFINEQLKKL